MGRISNADRKIQLQAEEAGHHLYANRVRVYPKSVHGSVRRIKWAVLIFCLTVYYALPWLRWDRGPGRPGQALLLDIADRRFYIFGLEFWPQDIYYLTGLLILGAVGLFLVTSVAGRIWCGFTCPQTVWTDLFMWVERLIEGDRNERMRRDAAPMTLDTAWRKIAKHAVWLGVAFWTGGAWIMYYVDAPTVTREFWTGSASAAVYGFTFLFTATTYLLAGWAREQVCTYMCPWPRFQAAMLDEQSFIVTYQGWRGEPRGHLKAASAEQHGDCIDCGACVTACPTGIDIRDGVQLECIGCGLCVDACNHAMSRVGRAPWLITWDTLARQSAKSHGEHAPIRLLRPRTIIYAGAMCLALVAMGLALATRPSIGLSVLHDRAPLFVRLPDGEVRNGYTVKIINKTPADQAFELMLSGLPGGTIALAASHTARAQTLAVTVGGDRLEEIRIVVAAPPPDAPQTPVEFRLRNVASSETTTYHAAFLSPAAAAGAANHKQESPTMSLIGP
jgi:cytochrome c oxidase accessory protein FixG